MTDHDANVPTNPSSSENAAPDSPRLVRLYLRDHDAASKGGLQLLRRTHASNVDTPFGPVLAQLLAEVEEDAAALRRIAASVGVGADPVKRAAAWIAVTLGGLKSNARILRYSPLSRVYEFEGLMVGVRAKRALWRALQVVARTDLRIDGNELDHLEAGADRQLRTLDELHEAAAALAFDGSANQPKPVVSRNS